MADSKRLARSRTDRMLGGVAGGVAEHFGIDPTLVRVVWVVAAVSGFGFLLYVILWIVLPEAGAQDHAIQIAEERFAHGEISAEDLAQIKMDLGP
jgi:phage shock protein C